MISAVAWPTQSCLSVAGSSPSSSSPLPWRADGVVSSRQAPPVVHCSVHLGDGLPVQGHRLILDVRLYWSPWKCPACSSRWNSHGWSWAGLGHRGKRPRQVLQGSTSPGGRPGEARVAARRRVVMGFLVNLVRLIDLCTCIYKSMCSVYVPKQRFDRSYP
jgi:hypothetical protein